jgi:uncharacterized GH25 family protein
MPVPRPALLFAGLLLSAIAQPTLSHEFMVLPSSTTVAAGEPLSAEVTMTETWIQPDRAPPVEMVKLERIDEAGRMPVSLQLGPKAHRATFTAPAGALLLAATMRRDRVEAPRVPAGAPKAEGRMTRSETFSKVYVNLKAKDTLWSELAGTRLEIVPLANPSSLKIGDTLPVKILFEGRPVATRVQAAYDGKGAKGHGFAVRTESGADGTVRIALTQAGPWLIRARHDLEETRKGYVRYVGGANLIVQVE